MAGSSNGTSDGILWIVTNALGEFSQARPGVLRALNSDTLAEIFNSGSSLGNGAKFNTPTVAAGKVFAPTLGNGIVVFGDPGDSTVTGKAAMTGKTAIQ
jgi:hypothetical protein